MRLLLFLLSIFAPLALFFSSNLSMSLTNTRSSAGTEARYLFYVFGTMGKTLCEFGFGFLVFFFFWCEQRGRYPDARFLLL